MSKCHICGISDRGTVLVKVQWFGRGTKWLCLDCVRTGVVSSGIGAAGERKQETAVSSDRTGESKPTYEPKA